MMFPNANRMLEVQVGSLELQEEIFAMMYELRTVATERQFEAVAAELVHAANVELAETMKSMGFIDTIESIVH